MPSDMLRKLALAAVLLSFFAHAAHAQVKLLRHPTYANGNVAAILGASRSVEGEYKGRKRVPANYIALVEKGTAPHAIGKGQHPGTKPRPFLEDAYAANAGQALDIASAKLATVLEKEAAALAGK